MHNIEPYYNWRDKYTAEEDEKSPFYNRVYNEFAFSNKIYNYFIHPQWDNIGSDTLYLKQLYADYKEGYVIIEIIGEWNDAIGSDIITLKRNYIDHLSHAAGINKFILIGEQVMNFHGDIDDYYEEWHEDVSNDGGWIVGVNFKDHVVKEMKEFGLQRFIRLEKPFNTLNWRVYKPQQVYEQIDSFIFNWLEAGLKKLATK